jgi:hypothetical protein
MKEACSINRKTLITRHNPVFRSRETAAPLSLGNGGFCFTADFTGLQTFSTPEFPLLTMAEWFWHTYPEAPQEDSALRLVPYNTYGRMVGYGTEEKGQEKLFKGLRQNAHKGNLVRVSLETEGASPEAYQDIFQVLNLWEGVLYSSYTLRGTAIEVETLVCPEEDTLWVRLVSPLIGLGKLALRLAFPYPTHKKEAGDFSLGEQHSTHLDPLPDGKTLNILRQVDAIAYRVYLFCNTPLDYQWDGAHTLILKGMGDALELALRFNPHNSSDLPVFSYAEAKAVTTAFWEQYWETGGVMDFSASRDPRAHELERRVALSQYLCAIQSRGVYPPAETGLTCNSWYGKFHLEMHLWHSAHFALWNRAAELEKSLEFYIKILEVAKKIAHNQGYAGARWPKMCDPRGYNSPSGIAVLLVWQQAHPLLLGELCYQALEDQEQKKAFLLKYREVVIESVRFMASFIHYHEDGSASLGPPVIPVQERFDPNTVCNPGFELEYFRWAFRKANEWLRRLGEPENPQWTKAAVALPDPPLQDGLYLAHEGCPETFSKEPFFSDHPSMLMMYGLLPGDQVDKTAMSHTLDRVLSSWDMDSLWGWDFPMMAMTAARLGRSKDAVDLLLMDNPKNIYLANGHNAQGDRDDLPLYLPGNGGLLLAVAMMKERFPEGWKVKTENIGAYI